MKKALSVLLALVIVFPFLLPAASAENEAFPLRNGIVFGDTLETVWQKETATIDPGWMENADSVWFLGGSLDGNDIDVRYDFDEATGTLTDLLCSYDLLPDRQAAESEYTRLLISLVREYGTPLGYKDGTAFIITGEAFPYAASRIAVSVSPESPGSFLNYDEWIVSRGEYSVKIDLVSYSSGDASGYCQNLISYRTFTQQEYEDAVNAMLGRNVTQTGWQFTDGEWFYYLDSGETATGWQQISDIWYYFSDTGAMATGWKQIGGEWYYFTDTGLKTTGWKQIGDAWYYFIDTGAMVTGWKQIDSAWYYFTDTGTMITGWFEDKKAEEKLPPTQKKELWYWFDDSGRMATGWTEIDGKMERFDDSGLWLYTFQGN